MPDVNNSVNNKDNTVRQLLKGFIVGALGELVNYFIDRPKNKRSSNQSKGAGYRQRRRNKRSNN